MKIYIVMVNGRPGVSYYSEENAEQYAQDYQKSHGGEIEVVVCLLANVLQRVGPIGKMG